jgi:predicted Rdx family selenoprotein
VWWLATDILEDFAASIFRVHFNPEDGGSMVLQNVGIYSPPRIL